MTHKKTKRLYLDVAYQRTNEQIDQEIDAMLKGRADNWSAACDEVIASLGCSAGGIDTTLYKNVSAEVIYEMLQDDKLHAAVLAHELAHREIEMKLRKCPVDDSRGFPCVVNRLPIEVDTDVEKWVAWAQATPLHLDDVPLADEEMHEVAKRMVADRKLKRNYRLKGR